MKLTTGLPAQAVTAASSGSQEGAVTQTYAVFSVRVEPPEGCIRSTMGALHDMVSNTNVFLHATYCADCVTKDSWCTKHQSRISYIFAATVHLARNHQEHLFVRNHIAHIPWGKEHPFVCNNIAHIAHVTLLDAEETCIRYKSKNVPSEHSSS